MNFNMKNFNIYIAVLAGLFLFGCSDLDTFPEGGTVTEDQKKEVVSKNPEMLRSDVTGLYASLIKLNTLGGSTTQHYDFGHAGVCLMLEASGQDMPAPNSAYNWFSGSMIFDNRLETGNNPNFIWKSFYNHIKAANNILEIVTSDTEDPTLKSFRGQALASRAFDYLHLAQIYQFTYNENEDKPAVPIVTEKITQEQSKNNPRASLKDVYELIIADLDEAIILLETFNRPAKDVIDQKVAYGLRARAHLLMQNWQKAAQDAEKAMQGASPYSLQEISNPAFNSALASSWIWGNIISETNDVVRSGIVNWPSHLCSLTGNGYTTLTGTYRWINNKLWDEIPSTDARKGWWVDQNLKSPLVDNMKVTSGGKEYSAAEWFKWDPYTNVKFGSYKDVPNNTLNASDWPLMRAEEMILIRAEGMAMSGNVAEAKAILENFVRTYRDPSYTCNAASSIAMQDEIWFQRRIELWGEGFSFFDLQRLRKPMDRSGATTFPEITRYNLPAESKIFLWLIPESEITANEGISEAQNNERVNPPKI
ncbi:membrane protein [Bacteroidales bacterium]|nr:membrane protein [Bacteroidales bacterium]